MPHAEINGRSQQSDDVEHLRRLEKTCIGGKIRLIECIGRGSFGTFILYHVELANVDIGIVYRGHGITSQKEHAVKVKPYETPSPQLEHEFHIYRQLNGGAGIPRTYWLGAECQYNVMIMDLLGSSLDTLFTQCWERFTVRMVALLANQLVSYILHL